MAQININLVSYLDPFAYTGGGELVVRDLISGCDNAKIKLYKWARRDGKLSKLIPPRRKLHPNPDLWILVDVHNCPDDRLPIEAEFVRSIIHSRRYIHVDNAYVDICSCASLPCNGERESCLIQCQRESRLELYQNSICNYFLSPLHRDTVAKIAGLTDKSKLSIIHPTIDTEIFRNYGLIRDIDFLAVGTIARYKGYHEIKNRFEGLGKNFVFIGRNSTGEKLFGTHLEWVSHDQMPSYFNRAKSFVHLPCWKEPMGRAVVEAALCGCKIITNSNVGAASFNYDISNPTNLRESASKFWREVEILAQ